MSDTDTELSWIRQQAEMTFILTMGSEYPTAAIGVVYEENARGEKRFVEQNTFNLIEQGVDLESEN